MRGLIVGFCLMGLGCGSIRSLGSAVSDGGPDGMDSGTVPVAADAGRVGMDADPASMVVDGGRMDASVVATPRDKLSLGERYSCLLRGGRLFCWGAPIGDRDRSRDFSGTPQEILFPSPVRDVAAGDQHTCAVLENGTVWCWGHGAYDALTGSFDTTTPVRIAGLPDVGVEDAVGVAVGYLSGCAFDAESRLGCWGYNGIGQIGVDCQIPGSSFNLNSSCELPKRAAVVSGHDIVGVEMATFHSCAITTEGEAYCWGHALFDALGPHTFSLGSVAPRVDSVTDAVELTLGGSFSCVRNADATVSCWGNNRVRQLGRVTTGESSPEAVAIEGLPAARSVSAGYGHACIASMDGEVWCWGGNSQGQASGDRASGGFQMPMQVTDVPDAVAVSTGFVHTCALHADGSVTCWGSDDCGQLGRGSTEGDCAFEYSPDGADITGGPALVEGLPLD